LLRALAGRPLLLRALAGRPPRLRRELATARPIGAAQLRGSGEGGGEGRRCRRRELGRGACGRREARRAAAVGACGGGLGQRPRGAGWGEEGVGQPSAVGRRIDGHDLFR